MLTESNPKKEAPVRALQIEIIGHERGMRLEKLLVMEKHEGRILENTASEQDTSNIGSFGNVGDGVTVGVLFDKKNSLEEKFAEFLFEAIDEVLSSLREPVKNTMYLHLLDDFNIEKNEIPQRIDGLLDSEEVKCY